MLVVDDDSLILELLDAGLADAGYEPEVTRTAEDAFERVLSADPTHARARYHLGRAYLSAGDYELGKQYLQEFIEMAPDDPEVENARSMLSYLD